MRFTPEPSGANHIRSSQVILEKHEQCRLLAAQSGVGMLAERFACSASEAIWRRPCVRAQSSAAARRGPHTSFRDSRPASPGSSRPRAGPTPPRTRTGRRAARPRAPSRCRPGGASRSHARAERRGDRGTAFATCGATRPGPRPGSPGLGPYAHSPRYQSAIAQRSSRRFSRSSNSSPWTWSRLISNSRSSSRRRKYHRISPTAPARQTSPAVAGHQTSATLLPPTRR